MSHMLVLFYPTCVCREQSAAEMLGELVFLVNYTDLSYHVAVPTYLCS